MDFIKSLFGEGDKEKKELHSENPPQKPKKQDSPAHMKHEEDRFYMSPSAKKWQEAVEPKTFGGVFTFKPLEADGKLTVILVENTKEVAKEKDKLEKIVKNLVTAGQVCVINYGSSVKKGEIVEAKDFECSELLDNEYIGDNTCLFDALIALEGVVDKNYRKIEELEYKRIRTKYVDIIGIGKCVDNCSITSSKVAIESFCRVAKLSDVTTKYFCLSEESFVEAATIGFHSIGAIPKN